MTSKREFLHNDVLYISLVYVNNPDIKGEDIIVGGYPPTIDLVSAASYKTGKY